MVTTGLVCPLTCNDLHARRIFNYSSIQTLSIRSSKYSTAAVGFHCSNTTLAAVSKFLDKFHHGSILRSLISTHTRRAAVWLCEHPDELHCLATASSKKRPLYPRKTTHLYLLTHHHHPHHHLTKGNLERDTKEVKQEEDGMWGHHAGWGCWCQVLQQGRTPKWCWPLPAGSTSPPLWCCWARHNWTGAFSTGREVSWVCQHFENMVQCQILLPVWNALFLISTKEIINWKISFCRTSSLTA